MARQDFKTIENGLKVAYLPAWDNMIGITPSAFIAEMQKETLTGGKSIYSAASVGLSGGFGFGSEGTNNAPEAGAQRLDGFTIPICDMYTTIEISDKAIRLSQAESLVNAFDTEMNAAYAAAEWNIGRSAFGDGSGKLATADDVSAKGEGLYEVEVDDTSKLKEGLIIDAYTAAGDFGTKARIKDVNRTENKIVVKVLENGGIISGGNVFYVQNSKGRELTGLGAIINGEEIYGLSKASNNYLKPVVKNAGGKISDIVINAALREADREKGSKVNMLLCGDDAFDAYVGYLRETNQRTENNLELAGGFKAIKHSYGPVDVAVVSEQFVPKGEIWGVNTKDFTFKKTEWDFVTKDGSAFERISGSSNLQALLACYGNIVCKKPGGCIKITNVATA